MPRGGDGFHGEPLSRIVLDPAEKNQSDRIPLLGDCVEDIFFTQVEFAFSRRHLYYRGLRIEAMGLCL